MADGIVPRTKRESAAPGRVRLEPKDSFDLIRLLARSQSDARKAVGELVQNSLDAGARHVEITWFNDRGVRCLRIRDDGQGIFPGLSREEALRRIARTIGHSHKHALSPAERHRQMVLGKYGIGLLGFWCASRVMEIRSRVGGGDAWVLRLEEDVREGAVARARAQASLTDPTYTEVTLREVKPPVARQIRPPRLQAYLAGELRGQLLQREVEVRIHDRIARGRATKEFLVRPRAYLGLPLPDLTRLEVPGHDEARVELYFVPADEGRAGTVALACGGTTVLDDIARVDPTDPGSEGRAPWNSGRFEGVVDFPELAVAPGSRRGFLPDEAALDFLIALERLERELIARLGREAEERARLRRETVAREIRRAFTPVARRLPQYDLFDVRAAARAAAEADAEAGAPAGTAGGGTAAGADGDVDSGGVADGSGEPGGGGEAAPDGEELPAPPAGDDGRQARDEEPRLFPPGPLAAARIVPATLRLPPAAERGLQGRALDADGRVVSGEPRFEWRLLGPGELSAEATLARYRAPPEEAAARIVLRVVHEGRETAAEADVVVREGAGRPDRAAGIPEPEPVNAPSEPWRSRIRAGRWEYNEGHRDHLAVRDDDQRRLRYLIHLFAKELVLRNYGSPQEEELLERMVEVLTHLGEGRGR
jgi:hypothetical protein